ncbi:MAG: hypothetical protein GF346_11155, partial [Candidatus Eisenbacteria bacterium]|nr:hypothetical protein [Candidatus Latescibacterota bacterium]MBD3302993.1 hypothetical protein [Candidatus Eisenbacteria bacterium]
MRITAIVFGALLLCGVSGLALANDGIVVGEGSTQGGFYDGPREDLIHEWNADQEHSPAGTYSGGCFAYPYDPPMEYTLERVEWLAGGLGGTVTVQVRDGDPNGTVLGEVTYDEVAQTGWQGENLVPAVPVVPGGDYFIIYDVVPDADASTAAAGDIIPYRYASDCASYGDIFESIYWKARFYGTSAVPV